jgi:hypothetical protein
MSAKRATVAGIQDKENTDVAVISTTPTTMNEAFDAT